jgi:hypothetical protein
MGSVVEHELSAPVHTEGLDPFDYFETNSALKLVSQGIAYIKTESEVSAVQVTNWNPVWTIESDGLPIVALDGGGAAIHDAVSGALKVVNSSGVVISTATVALLAPSSAYVMGAWEGSDTLNGSLTSLVGPSVTENPTSFAVEDGTGNVYLQGGPKRPLLMHIMPVDPLAPTFTVSAFERKVSKFARTFELSFVRKEAADVPTIMEAFGNAKVWAVAFIGHAMVRPTTPFLSVGLKARDGSGAIIKKAVDPADQIYADPLHKDTSLLVDRIETSAKLIFIGSCNTNPEFQSLFGIEDTPSETRALVVSQTNRPPTPEGDTDLRLAAETAWIKILEGLDAHDPLVDAVATANLYLQFTTPDVGLRFKIIGNKNLHR